MEYPHSSEETKESVFLFKKRSGQSLIELLLAIVIGAIMITAGVAVIIPILESGRTVTEAQVAASLGKELLENARVFSESDWNAFFELTPGADQPYHLSTSTSPFAPVSGVEYIVIATTTYSRYFYRENILRDSGGSVSTFTSQDCFTTANCDPSTAKVAVVASSSRGVLRTITQYFTRFKNNAYIQTDWAGGPNQAGPLSIADSRFATSSFIDYTSSTGAIYLILPSPSEAYFGRVIPAEPRHWAWNDLMGWLDFYTSDALTVRVYSDRLESYATSPAGELAVNCNSTPIGNICGTSDFRVSHNGAGNLAGWGWHDTYGWVSFCGGPFYAGIPGCQSGAADYRVNINLTDGVFTGFAWNDIAGWISFNCVGHGGCTPSYWVETDWRPTLATGTLASSVFDTGVTGRPPFAGAQLNSIIWRGDQPIGTSVGFQIATSNCPNGATDPGPNGETSPPYCTLNVGNWVYSEANASGGSTVPVNTVTSLAYYHRGRYFTYRAILYSDETQTTGPRVDEVIINWSP